MHGTFTGHVLETFIAQGVHIDAVPELFTGAHEHRPDDQMQLVDVAGAQILPDGGHAATEAHVAAAGSRFRLFQCGLDAVGDEEEICAALHPDGFARMMREYIDRRVIRRFFTPPALPALIRPRAADGAEHIAPENPGADILEAFFRDAVIDAGLAALAALHLDPGAGMEEPIHHLRAAHAERILQILIRPGSKAVDGNRET